MEILIWPQKGLSKLQSYMKVNMIIKFQVPVLREGHTFKINTSILFPIIWYLDIL